MPTGLFGFLALNDATALIQSYNGSFLIQDSSIVCDVAYVLQAREVAKPEQTAIVNMLRVRAVCKVCHDHCHAQPLSHYYRGNYSRQPKVSTLPDGHHYRYHYYCYHYPDYH